MEYNLQKKSISGLAWKISERLIAQSVSLIVSIIIARIIAPEDYGVVSIVSIFFTFANVLISGGFNTALIQKKDADYIDYSTVLWFSLITSIIVYFILFFIAPTISELYGINDLVIMIRVMGLSLPVSALKAIWCAYIASTLNFRKFFFATIGGTIVSAVVGLCMAFNGFGAWSLIAQQMTNTFIDTIILILTTRVKIRFVFKKSNFKSLFGYGWKIFLASIISCIYNEINPLVVGVKYSSQDLSFYDKGKSFPTLISNSLSDSLSAVLFPSMSKIQDEPDMVRNYTSVFMKIGSFLIFPMMIGFLTISDGFISVVLTDKWSPASYYIRVFCIAYMFDILNVANLQTIKAIGRSDIVLKLEIIKKSLYFVVIILFLIFSKSPEILALSSIINCVAALIINSIHNKKLVNYSFIDQLKDIFPNLLISIIMGCFVYFLSYISLNKIILLIVQIISGIIIYFVLAIIFKNKSFNKIMEIIRSVKK